ncbi:MAG: dehydrogenase, partial [Sphingobacteriales bacterium]
ALMVNNKEAGTIKAPGVFKNELTEPLRVGFDNLKGDQRIMEYPDTAFFMRANLTNAKLETLAPVSAAAIAPKTGTVDQTITIKVVKDVMKFDKQVINVKAGTTVRLIVQNPDFMQHNLVLIKIGTLKTVGAAADKLAQDADGAKVNYVPKMPEVLQATPLINPGGKYTLTFKVPATAGDYPYVCTFPGHWRVMNGTMRVTK